MELELTKLYTFVGGKFLYLYQYKDTTGGENLYHADLFLGNSEHLAQHDGTFSSVLEWVLTLELPKLERVKVI